VFFRRGIQKTSTFSHKHPDIGRVFAESVSFPAPIAIFAFFSYRAGDTGFVRVALSQVRTLFSHLLYLS